MNGTQNLNIDSQNLEQCLKQVRNFGETIYKNICTGQSDSIPWGQTDWVVSTAFVGLTVFIIIGIAAIMKR